MGEGNKKKIIVFVYHSLAGSLVDPRLTITV